MSDAAPQHAFPSDVFACHALLAQQNATLIEREAQIAHLGSTLQQQQHTLTDLQRELQQLQHLIALLQRQRFGPRREKLDPNQLLLFDEPAVEQPPVAPPAAPETIVREHRRSGGGRNGLPADLPRETREYDLSDAEKACGCCGELRVRIGSDSSEQLDYVPASLKIIEHVRYKYACRKCAANVTRATMPPQPIGKGVPGPGLLSALVVGKYADHLPLYRLEDIFARHGVELARSTLCRWAAEVAELVTPLYDLMVQRVLASQNIHTDDTPVNVLDPNLPHCRPGRFWTYVGDVANPYSVYVYTPRRQRDGPMNFLKDYTGYLQADAFAGYDGIYTGGLVKQVLCWAHARRKFFEAKNVQPERAHRALGFIAQLYNVERAAKELAEREGWNLRDVDDGARWHAARYELRQQQALPILNSLHEWLNTPSRDVLPKSPVGQAVRYVLPRWDGFTRYCENGALAIDNNLAERTLRLCAIGRKNWTFLGSDNGGRTAAVLFTLTASCKANQVEPFAYLRDPLTELPTLAASSDLTGYLPDHWLLTHPDHYRPISR